MAFRDITKLLYPDEEGRATIKMVYRDKAHRYYAYPRLDFTLPPDDKKAWGKLIYPKGTTTLLEETLEKKGLMRYAMNKALMNLFGFYDFTGNDGNRRTGFSKEVGSLWGADGKLKPLTKEEALPTILLGSHASDLHKQNGANIGTVVHDAIEHYINLNPNIPVEIEGKMQLPPLVSSPFDIAEQYTWNIKEATYDSEAEQLLVWESFEADVAQAKKAFAAFTTWWAEARPLLYGAEDLLYSKLHNVSGTYDGDIGVPKHLHPVFKDDPNAPEIIRCTTDWKTSNASKSEQAAMPEGVNYQYFAQDALYEIQRREMGMLPADDLLVVSVRKDGGFSLVFASEIGLTVDESIDWGMAIIFCNKIMRQTKKKLWEHQPDYETKIKKQPKAKAPKKEKK